MGRSESIEHITLYKGQEFRNCTCTEKTIYSIEHSPRPIALPGKLINAIEMLLWYSPNNRASKQSFENEYIKNPVFEDALLTYYMRFMDLRPEDICFVAGNKLERDTVAPFVGAACLTCQKTIVAKRNNETKLSCLLRHLRNCLAHGIFNLLENESFLGFDMDREEYTAVFKTKIDQIYDFCVQLIHFPDFTVSHIVQFVLLNNGFTIIPELTGGYNFSDNSTTEELIFAIKDKLAIRVNCSRYRLEKEVKVVEEIKEYKIVYDEQFSENVEYIDFYYCESEREICRKLHKGKYVFGLAGLESLFEGNAAFLDLINAGVTEKAN